MFLSSAAAAAAAAMVARARSAIGATFPGTPSAPRTLRKAVGLGMVGDGATVLEKFALLKELGFEGVEVDRPSDLPIAELIAAQEKTGIRIHGVVDSVHWEKPLNHPEAAVRKAAIDGLIAAVKDAKALRASSVLLVPAVVDESLPYDEAWSRSQAAIREVLPLAAELQVVIAVENVWNEFLQSPLEAARYVDELASPWAAFHFDVGNVVNYGWPEQWIRVLGRRIAKLHIKDYSRKKRDDLGLWKGFDVELGEGDANYAAVMKALDETGFSLATKPAGAADASGGNWATAEVRGGDRARLKQVAEQMDRLFAL